MGWVGWKVVAANGGKSEKALSLIEVLRVVATKGCDEFNDLFVQPISQGRQYGVLTSPTCFNLVPNFNELGSSKCPGLRAGSRKKNYNLARFFNSLGQRVKTFTTNSHLTVVPAFAEILTPQPAQQQQPFRPVSVRACRTSESHEPGTQALPCRQHRERPYTQPLRTRCDQ